MVVLQSGERVPALGQGTSRMIMRAHRGTVTIEDNAESGAVFILDFSNQAAREHNDYERDK